MKMLYQAASIAVVVIALGAAGCAAKVAPVESMTSAELVIKVAKEGNAAVHAPLELKLAEPLLSSTCGFYF